MLFLGHSFIMFQKQKWSWSCFNPRLPEAFFVTRLPKEGVVTTHLLYSLDFCYKASNSYDLGTRE